MSIISIDNFDISKFDKETVFVLDTNILYFIHSGYYLPDNKKTIKYSNLIQNIIANGFAISVSTLNLQELYFGIENKEYNLYCKLNNINQRKYTKKDFRRNLDERENIKNKLLSVSAELQNYIIKNSSIDNKFLNTFINQYEMHRMDPIDFLLTNNYDINKTIFITDDKDFLSIPALNVLIV